MRSDVFLIIPAKELIIGTMRHSVALPLTQRAGVLPAMEVASGSPPFEDGTKRLISRAYHEAGHAIARWPSRALRR
jgi:hypothetical protein